MTKAKGACEIAEVREESNGRFVVILRGRLDLQSTAACWRTLKARFKGVRVTELEVDGSQLELGGGVGATLLRYLSEGGFTPGAQVTLRGLSSKVETILNTFTAEDFRAYRPKPAPKLSLATETGMAVRSFVRDLRDQVVFIGGLISALPRALVIPRYMRWREVRRIMEKAGANALPPVALFSVLVGLVIVLEAEHPLAKFGAQIFLADMIGFSSIRDTGPLVTAVLLAGRSGSAFAAELGTMKVNQELDALTSMGLDPIRFLVVQRVVAGVLLMPLLTSFAMVMGILGGMILMRSLGFPPLMIYHQILQRVGLGDVGVGLGKAVVFGLIVAGVGCLRGLQTGNGPSGVGVSTTRSVVACILLIIVANTVFSAAQYYLS